MSQTDQLTTFFNQPPRLSYHIPPEIIWGDCFSEYTLDSNFIQLQSSGFIHANYPFSFDLKALDCFLLIYTLSGSGVYTKEKEEFALTEQTLLISCVDKSFTLDLKSSDWHFYVAYLTGEALFSYLQLCSATVTNTTLVISDYMEQTFALIQQIHSLSPADSPETALSQSMLFHRLFTGLSLLTLKKDKPIAPPAYLVALKEYLESNYTTLISLDYLERMFSISQYRICREFKTHYQISPIAYLNQYRIQRAKELLLTEQKPIHEIGRLVGMENTNHFIRMFKKTTGTTPFAFKQAAPVLNVLKHSLYKPSDPLQ